MRVADRTRRELEKEEEEGRKREVGKAPAKGRLAARCGRDVVLVCGGEGRKGRLKQGSVVLCYGVGRMQFS